MFRNREGFTLIELLIVVVIIGILAAIALPKFGQTREAAYYTTMKADLNNLRSAQEMYYQTSNNFAYAETLADLEFTPSNGVAISLVGQTSDQGWAAEATHEALETGEGCAIAYGTINTYPDQPALDANSTGAPYCTDNPPTTTP